MSRRTKIPLLKKWRQRFSGKKRPPAAMYEALLVVLFGVVMIYGYSFAKKISYGAEAESAGPALLVRVQVLNGCGIKGAAGTVTESLRNTGDGTYQFDVVDQGNFATFDVTETLILDRGESMIAALRIAEILDVNSDHVIHQNLMENVLDIEVSVLLGSDFETLELPESERRP
jgi:hypothetical protein